MNKQARSHRRRWLYGALVVALIAVAIPVSYAFAGTGSKVTVPVVKYPSDCNYYPKQKVVGSATFERMKSGEVTVTYTLTGGLPSTAYYWGIESDSPAPCTLYFQGRRGVLQGQDRLERPVPRDGRSARSRREE